MIIAVNEKLLGEGMFVSVTQVIVLGKGRSF